MIIHIYCDECKKLIATTNYIRDSKISSPLNKALIAMKNANIKMGCSDCSYEEDLL